MKLHFHGAARSVTGSLHLLETRDGTVLLDCGLYQGPREEAFKRNRVFGFDVKAVHSVVLSHAHIDHSGALPALVKSGWKGPIYATPATAELAALMLLDSAAIQERDIQFVNEREGTSKEPLYTTDDAKATAALLKSVPYRLKRLAGRIPDIPVFVDSPLAADVTDVYRRHPECHEPGTWTNGDPFGFNLLRTVRSPEESKKLNDLKGPAIIIAASGMCE